MQPALRDVPLLTSLTAPGPAERICESAAILLYDVKKNPTPNGAAANEALAFL